MTHQIPPPILLAFEETMGISIWEGTQEQPRKTAELSVGAPSGCDRFNFKGMGHIMGHIMEHIIGFRLG